VFESNFDKNILHKKKLQEREELRKSLTWVKMRKSNETYLTKMDFDGSDDHQGPSESRPPCWEQQSPEVEEIDSE